MKAAISNINGKIWLFLDDVVQWDVMIDTEQQLTIMIYHQDLGKHIMMTFVYAKYCSSIDRLKLWDNLYYLGRDMELPWVVGGDFNVIFSEEDKIGGLSVYPLEYEDFSFCVNSCGLYDMGYKGSSFTWCNGRSNAECDPFLMFKKKLKRVKIALSKWSKLTYGDIFKQLALREDVVRVKEMLFEEEPTVENRIVLQKAQAELKRLLSIEEQFWKQKAGITWFAEGDRNTRFFHSHVNGKRQKL
ncbi:uncharacterized protein LOC142177359 [Nicotiana tabacum]|uniref:Uncharacterized protein LOC142177359 n=1 Tax=Nicotiana tabacum TaxID=4097 RepID=A0AC58TXI5_TOBAC